MGSSSNPKPVKRYDTLDAGSWMTTPFTRTAEGFLTGRAIVTSIGVFTYQYADGSVIRELRLPEEVFAYKSLESMKLKPVTNLHPAEFVNPENQKDLQVGSLGSDVTTTTQRNEYGGYNNPEEITDGIHVAIDMTINRADAIEDVLKGRRALSMGYTCDLEESSGVYMGVEYDCIQRNIRYNHCAIVDAARAGDAARIHLDGADAILTGSPKVKKPAAQPTTNKDHHKQEDKSMKKTVRINGVDVEIDDSVASFIAAQNKHIEDSESKKKSLEEEVADLKKTVSKLEAERDAEKSKADSAQAELKKAREDAADDAKIDAAVQERLAVLDAADKAGVKVTPEMKMDGIRRAVIEAVFPSVKLDGKNGDYVSACFDSAVAELEKRGDAAQRIIGSDGFNKDDTDNYDAAAARQRMIDYNQRRSRGEEA